MATAPEEMTVKEPLDLVKLSMDERIYVKCRHATNPGSLPGPQELLLRAMREL